MYKDQHRDVTAELALPEGERINFVAMTTPNNWHFPIARDFLKAGKAICCEKPLAMNIPQAQEMIDAVEKAGVIGDLLPHCIDTAMRQNGPITSVCAMTTTGAHTYLGCGGIQGMASHNPARYNGFNISDGYDEKSRLSIVVPVNDLADRAWYGALLCRSFLGPRGKSGLRPPSRASTLTA